MICQGVSSPPQIKFTNQVFITSAITLTISAVVMAILFTMTNPLGNAYFKAALYADAALGGAAVLGLIYGGILKASSAHTQDLARIEESAPEEIHEPSSPAPFDIDKVKAAQVIYPLLEKEQTVRPSETVKCYFYNFFEHADFPNTIFSYFPMKDRDLVRSNWERCQKVLVEHPECTHIKIPAAIEIPLAEENQNTAQFVLFAMEKPKGLMSEIVSKEVSERAFEEAETDPLTKAKWKAYFRDAARLICLTNSSGFYWGGMVLSDQGLCYLNFDDDYNEENRLIGLSCLLENAAPDYFAEILEVAALYGIRREQLDDYVAYGSVEELKQARKKELDMHSLVRQWHISHNIQADTKLDEAKCGYGSAESIIVADINAAITERLARGFHNDPLIHLRKMWNFQPYLRKPAREYEASFDQALLNLQKMGLICCWKKKINSDNRDLSSYDIYF